MAPSRRGFGSKSAGIGFSVGISYLYILVNVAAGLVVTPWLTRSIGVGAYGVWTLVNSVVAFLSIDFGLNAATARFVAKYLSERREDRLPSLMGVTLRLYLVLDGLLLVLLAGVWYWSERIFPALTADETELLRMLLMIVGASAVCMFPLSWLPGVFTGAGEIGTLRLIDIALKLSVALGTVLALELHYGILTVAVITAICSLSAVVLRGLVLRSKGLLAFDFVAQRALWNELLRYSAWTAAIVLAQRLLVSIVPSLLGALSGARQVAIFGVGAMIEGYLWLLGTALTGVFLRPVSDLWLKRDLHSIDSLMIKVGRLQYFVFSAVILVFSLVGRDVLGWWLGPGFEGAHACALLLMVPTAFALIHEVGLTALVASGEVRYRAFCLLLAGLLSFPLVLFLAPQHGARGAAFAIAAGNSIFVAGGLLVVYRRVLGLGVRRFLLKVFVASLPATAVSFAGMACIGAWLPGVSVTALILKVGAMSCWHLGCAWVLGLSAAERGRVLQNLRSAT